MTTTQTKTAQLSESLLLHGAPTDLDLEIIQARYTAKKGHPLSAVQLDGLRAGTMHASSLYTYNETYIASQRRAVADPEYVARLEAQERETREFDRRMDES